MYNTKKEGHTRSDSSDGISMVGSANIEYVVVDETELYSTELWLTLEEEHEQLNSRLKQMLGLYGAFLKLLDGMKQAVRGIP